MTCHTGRAVRGARGISLIFALITLVALSLAAVALVRSVDNASLIAGNLGFKQDATAYAAQAAEDAITYLDDLNKVSSERVKLDKDDVGAAYYATSFDGLDPTDSRPKDATRAVVDWAGDGCATGYAAGSFSQCLNSVASTSSDRQNATRYVITRLCIVDKSPSDPANVCARPVQASLSEGGEKGALNYPGGRDVSLVEGGPYYRIVVRSTGARNTVSYTETIVHF